MWITIIASFTIVDKKRGILPENLWIMGISLWIYHLSCDFDVDRVKARLKKMLIFSRMLFSLKDKRLEG